jgi:hypothetical protein
MNLEIPLPPLCNLKRKPRTQVMLLDFNHSHLTMPKALVHQINRIWDKINRAQLQQIF